MLCDVDMPVMSGHEVMAKAYSLQPSMIRIFVTGAGDIDAAVRAINEGEVHRFVRKPFDAVSLRNLIHEALDRKNEIEIVSEASSRVLRRRQLYSQLNAEHPGITDIEYDALGAYVIDTDRISDVAGRLGFSEFLRG